MAYADALSPTPNHVTLTFACASEVHRLAGEFGLKTKADLADFREKLARHLREQVENRAHGVECFILSSAALTGIMRQPEDIKRLKTLLDPIFDEIKIFVYVRRQDDALLMRYNDLMRRGQTKESFEDFVETCLGPTNPMPHLNYRTALMPWVNIWGRENIILRRFSPVDFIHGDIMADVLGVLQGTWDPELSGFVPAADSSRMLCAPALEYLRLLHPHFPFFKDGQANPRRRALLPAINDLPEAPRPIMHAKTSRMIMGYYKASNNWLRDLFTPLSQELFFPERPDHPEIGNLGQLTAEQAAELSGLLLKRLDF